MLQRYVEIAAHLGMRVYEVEKFVCDLFGIEIEQSYPLDRQLAQPLKKFGQLVFAVKIFAVSADILRDDDQFFDRMLRRQSLCLFDDALDRARSVPAAYRRYRAICTSVAAPFRYFEVGIMLGCGEHSRRDRTAVVLVVGDRDAPLAGVETPDHVCDFVVARCSEPCVDLGYALGKLLHIALRQTARGDQKRALAFLFIFRHFEQSRDRLFLCAVYERASVDDDHVRLSGVLRKAESLAREPTEHLFGVDPVLVASERYNADRDIIHRRLRHHHKARQTSLE